VVGTIRGILCGFPSARTEARSRCSAALNQGVALWGRYRKWLSLFLDLPSTRSPMALGVRGEGIICFTCTLMLHV
jgi:hypothetical protein